MSVRIAGVGQGGEPKNMIVGFPYAKHKMELTSVTGSSGNTKASHSYSWGDFNVSMSMTVSANDSGKSADGIINLDTTDYYDLTAFSKLCIAANHVCGSHTGHAWGVYLVSETGEAVKISTGGKNKFTATSIDISQYTGRYKIRIRLVTGYATYGYGASTTSINVSTLALMK